MTPIEWFVIFAILAFGSAWESTRQVKAREKGKKHARCLTEIDRLERELGVGPWAGHGIAGHVEALKNAASTRVRSDNPFRRAVLDQWCPCPACAEPIVGGEMMYVMGCDGCARRQEWTRAGIAQMTAERAYEPLPRDEIGE